MPPKNGFKALVPSILITDDDSAFRETLRETVERRGYKTLLAADGTEAIAILETEPVDVAVLDIHMPRLGGLETLARLHAMGLALPCILLSGRLDASLRREADRIRAFTVLSKPVSAVEFTGSVERALRMMATGGDDRTAPRGKFFSN